MSQSIWKLSQYFTAYKSTALCVQLHISKICIIMFNSFIRVPSSPSFTDVLVYGKFPQKSHSTLLNIVKKQTCFPCFYFLRFETVQSAFFNVSCFDKVKSYIIFYLNHPTRTQPYSTLLHNRLKRVFFTF